MKAARKGDNGTTHVTPSNGNVFADLGFSPKEARTLLEAADAKIENARRLKQQAALEIMAWMQEERLTQSAASEILEVSRPRVSDLVNHKLSKFSLDMLVGMLARTGKRVELIIR